MWYSSTYMSWTSDVFIIQKSRARKHRDKRPCGAKGIGEWLPDNLAVREVVDLADEVEVRPLGLLRPRELQTRE
jgi:hypothetical protein